MIDQAQRRAADPGRHVKAFAVLSPDAAAVDTGRCRRPTRRLARLQYLGVARPVGAGATPPEVIAKIHAAVVAALADPATREKLAGLGQDIPPADQQTPQALAASRRPKSRMWPIVKGAGIKANDHEVGVLQFFAWPGRTARMEDVFARALERIEIMDKGGFDAVWLPSITSRPTAVCPSVHMMGRAGRGAH